MNDSKLLFVVKGLSIAAQALVLIGTALAPKANEIMIKKAVKDEIDEREKNNKA